MSIRLLLCHKYEVGSEHLSEVSVATIFLLLLRQQPQPLLYDRVLLLCKSFVNYDLLKVLMLSFKSCLNRYLATLFENLLTDGSRFLEYVNWETKSCVESAT